MPAVQTTDTLNTPTTGDAMTTTAATAHADQIHAQVRDARCCDALTPCQPCTVKTAQVRSARRMARVEAGRVNAVPQSMLAQRLAQFAL